MAEHAERPNQSHQVNGDPTDKPGADAPPPEGPRAEPNADQPTQAIPQVPAYSVPEADGESKPKHEVDWRAVKNTAVGFLAGLARWVGLAFALVLVLHVIFVVGDANADNVIVSFVREWAQPLSVGFRDLFEPADPKLDVLVNYGIAAIFWLIVSSLVAKIIRRVGGAG